MTITLIDAEGVKQQFTATSVTYKECVAKAEQLMVSGTWFVPNPVAYYIQFNN